MPLGPLLVFGNQQGANPGASVVTLFCNDPIVSGANAGTLTTTQPGASTSTTGWTVGTTASANYARQFYNAETTEFITTAQPFGPPVVAGRDCWRYGPLTGQFSRGTWYSSLSVIGVTSGGDQDGRVRVRVWRARNANGVPSGTTSDDFTRADSATRGVNWTSVSGANSRIVSNEAAPQAAGSDCLEYYNPLTPGAAQFARVTLRGPFETATNAGGCGPAVRIQTGADTAYTVRCNTVAAERFRVFRRVAGVESSILTYTGTVPTSGDVVELRVNADFILDLWVNGSLRASVTDTNANKIATGRVGDYGKGFVVDPHWDDWEGGDLGLAAPDDLTLGPGTIMGTTVTNLSTSVAQSSSGSAMIPAFPMANDYLFMQAAWEITGAGAAADRDVLVRYGSMGATDGSGLVTAAFAVAGAVAVVGGGAYFQRRKKLDAMTYVDDL